MSFTTRDAILFLNRLSNISNVPALYPDKYKGKKSFVLDRIKLATGDKNPAALVEQWLHDRKSKSKADRQEVQKLAKRFPSMKVTKGSQEISLPQVMKSDLFKNVAPINAVITVAAPKVAEGAYSSETEALARTGHTTRGALSKSKHTFKALAQAEKEKPKPKDKKPLMRAPNGSTVVTEAAQALNMQPKNARRILRKAGLSAPYTQTKQELMKILKG